MLPLRERDLLSGVIQILISTVRIIVEILKNLLSRTILLLIIGYLVWVLVLADVWSVAGVVLTLTFNVQLVD